MIPTTPHSRTMELLMLVIFAIYFNVIILYFYQKKVYAGVGGAFNLRSQSSIQNASSFTFEGNYASTK